MNGVVEMAFEDRRALISAARSAFMAAPISSGLAVDSTYFLQTDFRTGMSSGVRVPGPIAIWPHGNADMRNRRDKKCIPRRMMTII